MGQQAWTGFSIDLRMHVDMIVLRLLLHTRSLLANSTQVTHLQWSMHAGPLCLVTDLVNCTQHTVVALTSSRKLDALTAGWHLWHWSLLCPGPSHLQ